MEPKINIDIKKTTGIKCDKCDCEVFQEGLMLRKASKFLTGTSTDSIIPIQVFACSACGNVNDDFLPKELKSK